MSEQSKMQKECKHEYIEEQASTRKGYKYGVCETCGLELCSQDNGVTWKKF